MTFIPPYRQGENEPISHSHDDLYSQRVHDHPIGAHTDLLGSGTSINTYADGVAHDAFSLALPTEFEEGSLISFGVYGWLVNNTGVDTNFTIEVAIGATTWLTHTLAIPTSASRRRFVVDGNLGIDDGVMPLFVEFSGTTTSSTAAVAPNHLQTIKAAQTRRTELDLAAVAGELLTVRLQLTPAAAGNNFRSCAWWVERL